MTAKESKQLNEIAKDITAIKVNVEGLKVAQEHDSADLKQDIQTHGSTLYDRPDGVCVRLQNAEGSVRIVMRIIWAVVGAGITGLSAAWELQDAGVGVHLFDGAPQAGGVMRSELTNDCFLLEWGPNTIQGTPAVWRLAELSGTTGELVEANEPFGFIAYIHQDGITLNLHDVAG